MVITFSCVCVWFLSRKKNGTIGYVHHWYLSGETAPRKERKYRTYFKSYKAIKQDRCVDQTGNWQQTSGSVFFFSERVLWATRKRESRIYMVYIAHYVVFFKEKQLASAHLLERHVKTKEKGQKGYQWGKRHDCVQYTSKRGGRSLVEGQALDGWQVWYAIILIGFEKRIGGIQLPSSIRFLFYMVEGTLVWSLL